jgi:hypothetical protein
MEESNLGAWIGGIAVGLVLAVLAWLIVSPGSGSSGSGGGADQAALTTGETSASSAPQTTSDTVSETQRCREAVASLRAPLRRAASSVAQWEIHVAAMNKLVLGVISLRQATAFWNRTRVGARDRVARFERAREQLLRHGVDCPSPVMLPARAPQALRACARQAAGDLRVLDAAETAIGTWRKHMRAMEMLRMGKMSAATAGRMWLAMWHRGQHEITAYRHAARAARQLSGCSATG